MHFAKATNSCYFKKQVKIHSIFVIGILQFLMLFFTLKNVSAEVTIEKTWFSTIGFEPYSFSPKHTYGISNSLNHCKLYNLKTGNLLFQVDTTKILITDYTGKTFFIKDTINQKLYVYDLAKLEFIKELTYRNYIENRAVNDSLMFVFDTENQTIKLWNIYEDKIVMQKDLKLANNYPGKKYNYIIDHSYDGRFIRFSQYKYYLTNQIYDCETEEFIVDLKIEELINHKSSFMNLTNKFVYIEKMKIGSDTIESDYFRFYDLEKRNNYKDVKVMQYRDGIRDIDLILINNIDDFILYYISGDFFPHPEHNIYDIENDEFNEETLNLTNPPIYFGNSIIVDFSNQAYRVKAPTSIQDNYQSSKFSLRPNPASDFIEISIPDISNHTLKSMVENGVQIFNILGIEVGQSSLIVNPNNTNGQAGMLNLLKIGISHLPTGVYFVKIGNRVEKFVKM